MQKIKVELFDNNYYIVKGVNNITSNISYVDFTISQPIISMGLVSSPMSVSPNIFTKTIQLHRLDIPVNKFKNIDDLQETHTIYKYIKNAINKEYFKIISELGEKNRIDSPISFFDIFIDKLRKETETDIPSIGRRIYSKFVSAGSYISSNGRIGPAQWLISNIKTYNYIINYLDMDLNIVHDNKGNLLIGNMPYFVEESVYDDIILIGRKNNTSQPGIHCNILTDNDGYIIIQENVNIGYYQKMLSVFFSVDDIGITPQTQFLKINTRSLGYYRYKKLQRIKELYGNGL